MVERVAVMDRTSSRQSTEDLENEIKEMMGQAQQRPQQEIPDDPIDWDAEVDDEPEEEPKPRKKAKNNRDEDSEQEHDWKKRYSDLRRHSQQKQAELQGELNALKDRIQNMETKGSSNDGPDLENTSSAELKKLMQEYPDFGKAMRQLIREENNALSADIKKSKEELDRIKTESTVASVMGTVFKKHPNAGEIKQSPEWAYWLENEAKPWAKSAVFSKKPVADDIIDAIDAFKRAYPEFADEQPKKRKSSEDSGPPRDERVRSSSNAPSGKQNVRYSESMIEAAERRLGRKGFEDWFNRHLPAIEKARRNGTFVYDLSQPQPPRE